MEVRRAAVVRQQNVDLVGASVDEERNISISRCFQYVGPSETRTWRVLMVVSTECRCRYFSKLNNLSIERKLK